MSYTHSISENVTYTAGQSVTRIVQTFSQTAGAEANVSESFTDATDALVDFTLDVSQLKSLVMYSEGGDITVETNDGTTPGDTINLVSGQYTVYSAASGSGTSNPFSTDVTSLYITNTGTASLVIRALYDPTV